MRDVFDRITNTLSPNLRGPNAGRRCHTLRTGRRIAFPLLLLAGLMATFVPASWAIEGVGSVIIPENANVVSGTPQEFTFWSCPLDLNGNTDLGPDGIPGTSDDLCEQQVASWSVQGPIGTLSNFVGTSTTLTPASLEPGQTVSGTIIAENSLGTSSATVNVTGAADPMSCFAEAGETDKQTFVFISNFGPRFEIDLTCVNDAAAVAELRDHPTIADLLQFEVDMMLRHRDKYVREAFSRRPLDGGHELLRLEQPHELKFGRGRDREIVKVVTEIRELEDR